MTQIETAKRNTRRFETETVRIVSAIQDHVRDALGQINAPTTTAAELQRDIQLDMKLCWKVHRLIAAPDALAGAPFVLGPANTRDFLKSLEQRGADPRLVVSMKELAEQFEALVQEHAGDRRTFDSMVGARSSAEAERADLRQRRSAFRANSHLWGIQVDTVVFTTIYHTSESDPDKVDLIALSGEFGLRRIRRTDIPIFSKTVRITDGDAHTHQHPRQSPLGERIGEASLGLLRDFCSNNLPELTSRRREDGLVKIEIPHDALGSTAAMNIVVGLSERQAANLYRTPNRTYSLDGSVLHKPTKLFLFDLIVESKAFADIRPVCYKLPGHFGIELTPREVPSAPRLADPSPLDMIGHGIDTLRSPEVPDYPGIVASAMDDVGWNPHDFTIYRCRIEYPICLSTVAITTPLRPPPGSPDS